MHEKPNDSLSESSKNESIALKTTTANNGTNPDTEETPRGDASLGEAQTKEENNEISTDADGDVEMKDSEEKDDDGNSNKSSNTNNPPLSPKKETPEEEPPSKKSPPLEEETDKDEEDGEQEQPPQEPQNSHQPPQAQPPTATEETVTVPEENTHTAAQESSTSGPAEDGRDATAPAQEPATQSNGTSNQKSSESAADKTVDQYTARGTETTAPGNPPPPVMRGTLSFNTEQRKHIIRGMWNYEASNISSPQRFDLFRTLGPDEPVEKLPLDGEFSGSFSLAYIHRTSKGVQKERSKVVPESGVRIKFEKVTDVLYNMSGKGMNQFGVFEISGTAKPSDHEGDPVWNVEFRKRYDPTTAPAPAPPADSTSLTATSKPKVAEPAPLPDPSPVYENVVCLRGTMVKHTSQDLGSTEMSHRITGHWSSSLKFILSDPENEKGMLSKFAYEHKSTVPATTFPVSGKYSGWFDLKSDDSSSTRINESNVTLKFRENNAGHFNVEGKGSNVYGKYTITGTLTSDNVITIFRHFQPRKVKASKSVAPPPPPVTGAPALVRRASSAAVIESPKLKLEDAKIPDESDDGTLLDPIPQPENATYSAVSRGVLKVEDDGSHLCSGKWAITREHFTSGQTSKFRVRLDTMYVKEALEAAKDGEQFPLDSAMYKGSFELKKPGGRYQTIVDEQVVMRFRKNSAGSYNVYGRGINSIGVFNLMGTLLMHAKASGQVELYRMYPPELMNTAPAGAPAGGRTSDKSTAASAPKPKPKLPPPPTAGLVRRESSRTVKLPSRLEDDDPSALLGRIMDKCSQILRIMREKDVETGSFFSNPVDPVALGIPTYHQIIKEPMDLRTIARRMEGNEIAKPEEFARLIRLVFENAMKFNEDPAHAVHQAARNLLIQFNQKFREVELMVQKLRRSQGDGKKETKKKKKEPVRPKTVREIRFEEADAMAQELSNSMTSLMTAASNGPVSRTEFSMMLGMMQTMHSHMVQTRRLIAALSPDEVVVQPSATSADLAGLASASSSTPRPPNVMEKKKSTKRKAEALDEPVAALEKPLSREEQEFLTETINDVAEEHLAMVIQIIREGGPVGGDDQEEIDLDIDSLSNSTQRKLFRYVSKFVKKPPKSKAKKAKTAAADRKGKAGSRRSTPVPAATPAPAPQPAPPPPTGKGASASSLFGLDDQDDSSDSDSDDGGNIGKTNNGSNSGGKQFSLNSGLDALMGDNDDDDDEDEEDGEIGFGVSGWSLSKPTDSSKGAAALDDDAWAAARKTAEETKAFEEQRRAREEKMKAEAEELKKKRLLDAAQRGEEIRAQRQEEEAREAALREQKEKEAEEARQAAREAARAQVNAVEQTVDLDAQRDIMAQYEQSFLDKDMGGASPSSDFGF